MKNFLLTFLSLPLFAQPVFAKLSISEFRVEFAKINEKMKDCHLDISLKCFEENQLQRTKIFTLIERQLSGTQNPIKSSNIIKTLQNSCELSQILQPSEMESFDIRIFETLLKSFVSAVGLSQSEPSASQFDLCIEKVSAPVIDHLYQSVVGDKVYWEEQVSQCSPEDDDLDSCLTKSALAFSELFKILLRDAKNDQQRSELQKMKSSIQDTCSAVTLDNSELEVRICKNKLFNEKLNQLAESEHLQFGSTKKGF